MTDLRCPMCGKMNPEEAEACIHCQARLSPVHSENTEMNAGVENSAAGPQDWLRDLLSKSEADPETGSQSETEEAGALPDTITLPGEETTPGEDAIGGDDLDRLESLVPGFDKSGEQEATDHTFEPLVLPDDVDDTPAWLRPLTGETTEGIGTAPGTSDGIPSEGEDTGWMPLADKVPGQQPTGVTDWLKALGRKTRPEEEESSQPVEEENDRGEGTPAAENLVIDLPEWLKEPGAAPAGEFEIPSEAAIGTEPRIMEPPEEDTPGWMKILDQPLEPAETAAIEAPTEYSPEMEASEEFESSTVEVFSPVVEETPDTIEEEKDSAVPTQIDADILDWLSSLVAEDLQAPANEAIPLEGIVGEEASAEEYLDTPISYGEEAEAEAGESTEEQPALDEESWDIPGEEIATGTESLNNEEEALPSDEATVQEAAFEVNGPLSGLPLIPVESISLQYRKPPAYSSRLKVSDKERASAELLEKMVAGEKSARTAKASPSRLPQRLARLASGILLIAVMLVPLLIGTSTTAAPPPGPAIGAEELYAAIERLPAGATVLLATDFQPGYAGELRYATSAVLEHLMRKQASLVMVSTTPSGPVLAGDLLQNALENLNKSDPAAVFAYAAPGSIINLGYLAGGLASIQEFTRHPRQASLYGFSSSADALSPWESPSLQGIGHLQDFAAVVVVADSDDSGRAWIEQAQPSLGGQGLLLITSAQAGPMLSSYLYSGQLTGLVTGLPGDMAYQKLVNSPASSTAAPVSFRYGMLTGAVFLVVGLFLAIITSLFSHKGQGETRGR